MNINRRWLALCVFALSLILSSCTSQATQGAGQHATPTATMYPTPTATIYSTRTDTPTPEPTATPIPAGSLPPGTQVEMTDFQGFRFSVQEQTGTFSPTYVDDAGNTYTAPPGSDILVLHFVVKNLLTDRTGIFQAMDRDGIGIFGPCDDSQSLQAPNGQCQQNQNWVGWYSSVSSIAEFDIPVGGSAEFDYATQYPVSTDVTAMTMWVSTCKGDGDFYHCSLSDSGIPLAGGVHLSAPTSN